MEIRIYDAEMNFKGLIENQTSLLWNRKYDAAGSFELYCPVTQNNLALLQIGRLVWKKGAKEAGVIESFTLEQNDYKNQITVKGRFLESYMSRRLIRPRYNANNKLVESVMRELLENAVAIPLVQLGAEQGFTERVTFQATYKNLLEYQTKLARYAGFGFRFFPDFSEKTITFEIYKGVDRSVHQMDNSRVVFSQSYNNLSMVSYNESDQLQKTVAFVGGEGEGDARTFVVTGDDTLVGLERREMYVNASDVRSDGLTTAQYREALRQRGNHSLEENALFNSFECTTEAAGNFIYQKHYDLGDIITVQKNNWNLEADLRLTEITEIYETGAMKVSPVLGNPLPETIDWSDTNNG